MLLTISTTHNPATDLGYLLHKHPDKLQTFPLPWGMAHVFYPRVSEEQCTAVLLLDVNPIGLIRKNKKLRDGGFLLKQYVNDRSYTASSFMSSAINKVFSSALKGKCNDRPDLVDKKLPFQVKIAVLPCRGGKELLEKLFVPLGYKIQACRHPLDPQFMEWGDSPYYTVELTNKTTLQELLSHLYVLIPVLDNDKHYWVSKDEVEKLLKRGKGWLSAHPEKEQITRRYLRYIGSLTRQALEKLTEEEPVEDDSETPEAEEVLEIKISLHQQRLSQVLEELKKSGAKTVLDLGCGEGKLLKMLLRVKQFERICGMEVSSKALTIARERLRYEEMPPRQKQRINLIHGSLIYQDKRLEDFDAAAIVEVIEHLDEPRLAAFERVVFEFARPHTVIITTPNVEYNVKFESLPRGQFRHRDHRFEWSRKEFQDWANHIAGKYDYSVTFLPVGEEDDKVGAPSQMGVFKR